MTFLIALYNALLIELPPFHLTQPGDIEFAGGGGVLFKKLFTKT
jgi:hypothetical protein